MNSLSEDDIADFKEAFSLFDTDNDGTVSVQELGRMLAMFGLKATAVELQEVMDEADLGGTGALDFTEFVKFMGKKMERMSEANVIDGMFQLCTGGGDKIDAKSLGNVLRSIGENVSEEELQRMVQLADLEGKGELDEKDFEALVKDTLGSQ